MTDNRDANLANYWDRLPESVAAHATVDLLDAQVIAELEKLFAAPLPVAPRERARQHLQFSTRATTSELSSSSPTRKEQLPSPRQFPLTAKRSTSPGVQQFHFVIAAMAAAVILLLGSIAVLWSGVGGSHRDEHGGVIPAVIDDASQGWPSYRGSSARDGITTDTGPTKAPALLWSVEIGGSARMAPAVAGGLVYIGSSNKVLLALDVETGQERWRFEGDASMQMTPTVDNDTVYIPSSSGTLYALDAATGELHWTFSNSLGAYAMPAVANGLLFAGSMDGTFYAIDAETGAPVWTFETDNPFQRPAAVADGVVFAGNDDGHLYAISADDGTLVWRQPIGEFPVGMPTVANGTIYVAQTGGGILMLDQETGTPTMTLANPGRSGLGYPAVSSSIAVDGGGIDDPNLHVFDVTTGAEIATLGAEYDGPWLASPAIADGVVYAVSTSGKVLASDPTTGEALWTYHVEVRPNNGMIESGPVIANGVLYVSTDLGVIYALK